MPPRPSLPGDGSGVTRALTRVLMGCAAGGTTHPPGLPLCAELAGSLVHLPRPSPASCYAFEVVEDKINSPKWRLWLAALGERGVPEVGAEREQLGLLLMEK